AAEAVLETDAGAVQLGVRAEIAPQATEVGEQRAAEHVRLAEKREVEQVRPQLEVGEQLDLAVVALARNAADAVAAPEREGVLVARQLVERDVSELPVADGADREAETLRERDVEAERDVELTVLVGQVIAEVRTGTELDLVILAAPGRDLRVARVVDQRVLDEQDAVTGRRAQQLALGGRPRGHVGGERALRVQPEP